MAPSKLAKVREEVLTSYANKMSLRDIADLHAVNPGTVRNFLKREGVEIRSRGRLKKVQD